MFKKQKHSNLFLIGLLVLFLSKSCETDYEVELPESEEQLVVEGYIESGSWPYVILTRDQSYFEQINPEQINDLFIDSAIVEVRSSEDTVELKRISSQNVPPEAKKQLANVFQVSPENLGDETNLVAYANPLADFEGKANQGYELYVNTPEYEATATTRIPQKARLDSLYWEPHNDPEKDHLARVFMRIDDPKGQPKNYRYFSKRNDEPFFPPLFGSVANDEAVDGTSFNFPVDRGYARSAELEEPEDLSYFEMGDTVVVRFCSITREHYNFWSTLEEDLRNQGNPFGSPTIIQSNIEGGLGIWGGYGCDYDTLIIKE